MKSIVFFDEIMQNLWLRKGVGNSMKIFFIRNAPNNIPWLLKVFPAMPVMMFPFKNMKKSWFFSPVWHCWTPYSKSRIRCTRPNTAWWRPAARQLWSDGFRRLMNRFGCASSMLWSWWFTNSGSFFKWNFAVFPEFWWRGYSQQNISCVTQLAQPSWDDSYAPVEFYSSRVNFRPSIFGFQKITSFLNVSENRSRNFCIFWWFFGVFFQTNYWRPWFSNFINCSYESSQEGCATCVTQLIFCWEYPRHQNSGNTAKFH